ncbi:hypothetical protein B4U79_05975 [Dinothrombium tinctorium]|nr:hypothetical protein B4U79_02727 [Dinothrombium tinctorium]RWS17020.1 hypothetical protein B4U79_05975 [Dinothrombium tinctorium]
MRVGVHTGGVLAGVLGQRQWQFDVYSKDVELANKMESGGLPGRVHISEKTLSFLNGEFEVSNGDGASREEAIRLSGMKTYLIERVIKPGTLDAIVQNSSNANINNEEDAVKESLIGPSGEIRNVEEYNRRLRHELLNRDNDKNVVKNTSLLTLSFKDDNYEHQYRNSTDITGCVSLLGLPLTLSCCLLVYFLIGPMRLITYLVLLLSSGILVATATICASPIFCNSVPKPLASISQAVQEKAWIRLVIVISMIVIWIGAHIVTNVFYDGERQSFKNVANLSSQNTTVDLDLDESCQIPSYLVYFCVLAMLGVTAVKRIGYLVKMFVIFTLVIVQCCLNLLQLKEKFQHYDSRTYSNGYQIGHEVTLSIVIASIALALFIINRQFEVMSRRLFLWQKEVEEQKEKVADMRKKNEALLYNILPPHVASHFLGKRKKDDELYSKSYDAVGVLFAAMPNFSDFYTEESVNNQGLECLRFLNEVISDYDALLENAKFKDIIKIKTIGATYMAASGLNNDQEIKSDAPVKEKWAHLAQLTEFALSLKETLNNINKESFNNFVLRMGINQGPITAGVIGARKPHYDMWGNTVNVASRMESTGKAGCIQVVEETARILEEFGYVFEQRGLVSVKGKGKLMTYYLVGKKPPIT